MDSSLYCDLRVWPYDHTLKMNMRQGRVNCPYPEKRSDGRGCSYEHTLKKTTARTRKHPSSLWHAKWMVNPWERSGYGQTPVPWKIRIESNWSALTWSFIFAAG